MLVSALIFVSTEDRGDTPAKQSPGLLLTRLLTLPLQVLVVVDVLVLVVVVLVVVVVVLVLGHHRQDNNGLAFEEFSQE